MINILIKKKKDADTLENFHILLLTSNPRDISISQSKSRLQKVLKLNLRGKHWITPDLLVIRKGFAIIHLIICMFVLYQSVRYPATLLTEKYVRCM